MCILLPASTRNVDDPPSGFALATTASSLLAVACRLEDLGTPESVARELFEKQLARPGSGFVAELISASSRTDSKGLTYYELEYRVRRESDGGVKWRRRNLSILCARAGVLYTFNAQCRAERWENYADAYRRAADSFVLT